MSSVLAKGHDIARSPLHLRLRAMKEVELRRRWRLRRERQMRHRRPTTLRSTRSPTKEWTPESRGLMELRHHQLNLLEKHNLLDQHDPLKKDLVLLNLKKVLQKNQNETLQ